MAKAANPLCLEESVLSESGVYREGICCFTLIKSSHEGEGRWGYAGLGDMRVDVRV